MDKINEYRSQLLEQYKEILKQEENMEEDVLLGKRAEDISFEIDNTKLLYLKVKLQAAFFETLKPQFREVQRLSEEIFYLQSNQKVSNIEVDQANNRKIEFTNLNQKFDNMVYYNNDDLYEISDIMKELERDENLGDAVLIRESIQNARILRNLSRICTIEESQQLFSTLNSVIANLNEKLEELKAEELGEE